MDQTELNEKIREYLLRLPPELQEIVTNGKWVDTVEAIGKDNGLNVVQIGQLQQEMMLVMLGIIHPEKFLWDIQGDLGLPKEKIEKLVKESGDQVFKPIRQQLIEVYTKNAEIDGEDTEEETDTPAETAQEKTIFSQSGISIEGDKPKTTPSAGKTEDRKDMLADIENPPKSQPRVLNEVLPKPVGVVIPVPRAPYADNTQSANPVKETRKAPLSAAPAGILAGKLGGASSVSIKQTDHSLGSMSTGGDSYREPID